MQERSTQKGAWTLYSAGRRWTMLAILFLVVMSSMIDKQVMSVLLEPIKRDLHANDVQTGVLNGFAFSACFAVFGIPVAWLSDRKNRKVVITLSLAMWSAMTLLCGAAGGVGQMIVTRMGVGIGEAGAIPPAQSLIADYFAPEQRSRAFGILMSAATVGALVAFIGAAQISAGHGWRTAFVALGAPGLLLCLLTIFGLREPRRLLDGGTAPGSQESIGQALAALAAKRSFVLICVALALYYLVAFGVVTWFPAYMVRVLGRSLVTVGPAFGMVSAGSALAGTLGGGWLMDKLAVRTSQWLGWLPGALLIGSGRSIPRRS